MMIEFFVDSKISGLQRSVRPHLSTGFSFAKFTFQRQIKVYETKMCLDAKKKLIN